MNEGPTAAAPRPRKLLKTTLYTLGAITLVVTGTIAYLVSTFDPHDYRDRIVSLVLEKTGRTLDLQGEIGLSFWPDVAVRLGALSLSERQSAERFASVENARVRLKLRPLLSREIVASELVIAGAVVHIIRHADGRFNIDDLFKGGGPTPRFDVERVLVERSTLDYADLASGARYELHDLNVTTGRIAPGVITPLVLSFNARDASENLALEIALEGRLELDLEQRRHALHDADVQVTGRLGPWRDIGARATASFVARMQQNELSLSALSLSMKAIHVETPLTATVEARNVVFARGASKADGVRAGLFARGIAGATDIRLETASISHELDRLSSPGMTMNIAAEREGYRVTGVVSGPLEAELARRQVSLAPMAADLMITGPRLPAEGARAIVKGDGRLDIVKEALVLRLAGKIVGSSVKAQITAAGLEKPAYTFAIDVDQLDLKRYAAPAAASARNTPRDAAGRAAHHLLDPLAKMPATGTLTIGLLKTGDVEARDVRLVLK